MKRVSDLVQTSEQKTYNAVLGFFFSIKSLVMESCEIYLGFIYQICHMLVKQFFLGSFFNNVLLFLKDEVMTKTRTKNNFEVSIVSATK